MRIQVQLGNATQYRRDIQENSKLPFLATFLAPKIWHLQKSSFLIKAKIDVDIPEDARRRSISVALPNSSPITRWPNNDSYILNKWWEHVASLLWCPAQIHEFRCESLTSYSNRMCKKRKTLFYLFFFRQLKAAFVFFRIFASVIYIERKKAGIQGGRQGGRHALHLLVGAWSPSWQKNISQYHGV